MHVGLYPLKADNRCHWVAADFDGPAALLDALSYLKAARALGAPAALEVSRSGVGAHVWLFFTGAAPSATARRLGMGLLREAMMLRGEMDLSTPEPQEDQWAYLSTVGRISPKELDRLADRAAAVTTGSKVDRLGRATASRIHPPAPPFIPAALGAGLALDRRTLPAALLATLKHAASMPNPVFFERERRRMSTYNLPRFLRCYHEDLEDFTVPRGLRDTVEALVAEAGSHLQLTDARPEPARHEFAFTAQLGLDQARAAEALSAHELGKRAKGLTSQSPQQAPSRPEDWLVDRLVHTAGMDRDDVLAMTSEQAVDAWTAHVTQQR